MEDRVTDPELEEFERSYTLADTDRELNPETYPGLFNISAAFFYGFIPLPKETSAGRVRVCERSAAERCGRGHRRDRDVEPGLGIGSVAKALDA